MNRCAFCEWIPILPWPVWPLAGQCLLGQNVVVGSMMVLLALCGSMPRGSIFGPPFSLQVSCTTVKCRATRKMCLSTYDKNQCQIARQVGSFWTVPSVRVGVPRGDGELLRELGQNYCYGGGRVKGG